MKLTTTVKAPVLDMFSRDWEFEGKKGTAHFVVIYDYDNHTSERLIVDANNDKLFDIIGDIELLKEYKLTVVLNEAYGKLRKELVGVEELGK
jgi:hypothetical protein